MRPVAVFVSFFSCLYNISAFSTPVFEFNPEYLQSVNVFAAWNPMVTSRVLNPGVKILFFGRAIGCPSWIRAGPVVSIGIHTIAEVPRLTGLPVVDSRGKFWSPFADSIVCGTVQNDPRGDSFVYWSPDPDQGGIALFTSTGYTKKKRSFFEPFDVSGRDGEGTNAYIEGTFVNFRMNWRGNQVVRPWNTDVSAIEISTVQGVAIVSTGSGEEKVEPVQAKQQITVTFINQACWRFKIKRLGAACHIKYLFNLAVYRMGVMSWDDIPWAHGASVFIDPAQGNMIIIRSFLDKEGGTEIDRRSGLSVFDSLGMPTQHELFKDMVFRIKISRVQFVNALKIAAAEKLKKPVLELTEEDMTKIFGFYWKALEEWVLLSVSIGQEVHNPYADVTAHIGGFVKQVRISRIKKPIVQYGDVFPIP